jgi:hypothetical protein
MILDRRQFENIDFKKYERVFIFGCSFTNYVWPTWANILCYELKEDAKVYNLGKTGAGNLYITERISAADQKFRYNEKDLLLIMWSTFCREDRYLGRGWETPGNIWTQGFYDAAYVKKYADVRGYMVRDLGLMAMTYKALKAMPCDSIVLKSIDPDYDKRYYDDDLGLDDVIDFYRDVIYDMPLPLYEFVKTDTGGWVNGHHYHWSSISYSTPNTPFQDYHPNPAMYMDFLLKSGFKLSEETQKKTLEYQKQLMDLKERTLIEKWFDDVTKNDAGYHQGFHLI